MNIESKYTPTIGLEIHAELKTKSKLFCACKNDPFCSSLDLGVNSPNIYTCPVCLGLPGALPVINKQAVIDTIKIGKALNGTIAPVTKWDRKHYFYPDLPKGYQISQFDMPIVTGGSLEITKIQDTITKQISSSNSQTPISHQPSAKIRITRIHLEEDTGKLVHDTSGSSLVDLNRAGVPLVELVTEPDIHDGKTAAEFAREYQLILRTLGVADADMEKGMMRVEVNISLALRSQVIGDGEIDMSQELSAMSQLGTKVEIKNLNSFKSVEKAIEYEIKRQTEVLESGGEIVQETRGWDDGRGTTVSQRVKETSADYRYFPEPDLPPIDTTKLEIGEATPLPSEIRNELLQDGISENDINIVSRSSEMISQIKNLKLKIKNDSLKINISDVVTILVHNPKLRERSIEDIIQLAQLSPHQRKLSLSGETHDTLLSDDEIKSIIEIVLKKEIQAVADYKSGKQSVYGYLVGQVMRECGGNADPVIVNQILRNMI